MKMKQSMSAMLLCGCLLSATSAAAFADQGGHWAFPSLNDAVLSGVLWQEETWNLQPDAPISRELAWNLLQRTLQLDAEVLEKLEILLPDTLGTDKDTVSRAEAWRWFARAFGVYSTQMEPLRGSALQGETAWAAAGLTELGVMPGTSGSLSPEEPITNGEFVVLLDRLTGFQKAGVFTVDGTTDLQYRDAWVENSLLILPTVESVLLRDTTVTGAVVLHPIALEDYTIENLTADRLFLGGQESDLEIDSGTYGKIQIGQGEEAVALTGNLTDVVEIFSDRRTIDLSGMQLEQLVIAGDGNTILLDDQTAVAKLYLLEEANENVLTIDGSLQTALLLGAGNTLEGEGTLVQAQVGKLDANTIALPTEIIPADHGLTGVSCSLNAPVVEPGGSLRVTAAFAGVEQEKICQAQWYLDGAAITGYSNPAFRLTEGGVSGFHLPLEFTKDMVLQHTVGLTLTYQNTTTGQMETLTANTTVEIQNYPASHYDPPIPRPVLAAQVSGTYVGDYTTAYDIDYEQKVKEAFVNEKGYTSKTPYLLWISRHTQKVNIFTGKQGEWTLLDTHRCGTGKKGATTPEGVTYVTYKQDLWDFGSYRAYYITRFYPKTGYAFHTRCYYTKNRELPVQADLGYPISAGCIRMYDEAAKWIYDNIPLNTTVVIY